MVRSKVLQSALAVAVFLLPLQAKADDPGGHAANAVTGDGAEVYQNICKACHMADGKGAEGAAVIPALAGDARLAAPGYPVVLVLNGRGAMPGFKDLLTPAQIAAVATYVRQNFGNHYAKPVTVGLVNDLSQAGR